MGKDYKNPFSTSNTNLHHLAKPQTIFLLIGQKGARPMGPTELASALTEIKFKI
jgi:hypothetical protein